MLKPFEEVRDRKGRDEIFKVFVEGNEFGQREMTSAQGMSLRILRVLKLVNPVYLA